MAWGSQPITGQRKPDRNRKLDAESNPQNRNPNSGLKDAECESAGDAEEQKSWRDLQQVHLKDPTGDATALPLPVPPACSSIDALPVPPDGGYGWVICFAGFMCMIILDGMMYSFGIFYLDLLDAFG